MTHLFTTFARRWLATAVGIVAVLSAAVLTTATPAHAATCRDYVYGYGGTGTCVQRIQLMLNGVRDVYAGSGQTVPGCGRQLSLQRLTTDGHFGPLTETTVKKFQYWTCISQDGRVGPVTWSKLCYWADQPAFTQFGGDATKGYYAAEAAGC